MVNELSNFSIILCFTLFQFDSFNSQIRSTSLSKATSPFTLSVQLTNVSCFLHILLNNIQFCKTFNEYDFWLFQSQHFTSQKTLKLVPCYESQYYSINPQIDSANIRMNNN